jgi:hypothetical protein
MLATVTRKVLDVREVRSMQRHKTRMERLLAEPYTRYWERCRAVAPVAPPCDPGIVQAVRGFDEKGFTSFWTPENHRLATSMFQQLLEDEQRRPEIWIPSPEYNSARYSQDIYTRFEEVEQVFQGSLGQFLMGVYGSPFKIFYGVLYRSERITSQATGSQLWHDDGGPGTCINVMFYLKDVAKEDGALECLPWGPSMEVYKQALPELRRRLREASQARGRALSKEEQRTIRCGFYGEVIARSYTHLVEQPVGRAGLIVPFRNNIVHRGGYPQPDRSRCVCVFHCYPSDKPTPYERYRTAGIPKLGSLPKDPAGEF